MGAHYISQELKKKSVYELPLRVAYYARVSSEKDEQLNSLGNQISYFTDFIKKNKNWTYVEGYVDEGLSAITTTKRENFHRMIDDAKSGKFDMIITKEISRFARNTLDSIRYTRDLLHHGVGVFFQSDNINTFDEDAELRLTIMSGIAQDELRKLSSRIKFGHQQAIKNNVVLGNSRIFGYKKKNKKLVIDESQVDMIKDIFELYSTDRYSMREIENILYDKGYRNYNGNKISHTTLSNIISNPKYKGYYVGNKVRIVDMFTKKQKFLPEEEWVMFKDKTGEIVPAIVSEELWDKANAVLSKRSSDVKKRQGKCNHTNLLTGKMVCTFCDKPYYRKASKDRSGKKNNSWICSGKIKNGAKSCPSVTIYESEIKPLLYEVLKETSVNTEKMISKYVEIYSSINNVEDQDKKLKSIENEIEIVSKKKDKLLKYNAQGELSDNDFLNMNNQCNDEIKNLEIQAFEIKKEKKDKMDFEGRLKSIAEILRSLENDNGEDMVTREFVDGCIDKIYATPSEGQINIKIRLHTGLTSKKHLEKPDVRSGHMFKKMIEAYQQGMK